MLQKFINDIMYHICNMAMKTEYDGSTPVRLRNSTIADIDFIMKQNKIFGTPGDVVDFAIKKLIERGVKP